MPKKRALDETYRRVVSPIDQVALERWNDYSRARNEMLARTNNDVTPWFIVRADDKTGVS